MHFKIGLVGFDSMYMFPPFLLNIAWLGKEHCR